ncbi:CPBP family intramembrane metalloprotease [Corynebacterium lizhenjunii]|uniref:CPBP family intramembrane metalloprotease n=1 Tax=Corynebacterium lizhenjunii TaxID=2709394 RepID=A0A7T0P9P5_9CORY|nr:CPBP family intramembrane glutamic endopeptidase [Corynebacterium lizhenjunii]QPK79033.1 CPBP family intramembrane metalloprotease [Corynebacterium lizhenjunii]
MPTVPTPASTPAPTSAPQQRRRWLAEIAIVLAVTFGMSGVRSALRLLDALTRPESLSSQQVTLNSSQAHSAWLDAALQLCSAGVLFAWGALALFLLAGDGIRPRKPQLADAPLGLFFAALIGLPGLALYVFALHHGWSKEVIPADFAHPWVQVPALLTWSAANAFAEEFVVVLWLLHRLRGLGAAPAVAVGTSAVLRGTYHLYQGVSAGLGNLAMGVIFAYFYQRTGRIWPLVLAHFLIDAVAFVGYALLGDVLADLRWLGL